MTTAAILGVDVGLDGAIAIHRGSQWTIVDMPVLGLGSGKRTRREVNCAAIWALLLEQMPIEHVFVEHSSAFPKQGVAGVFSFGRTAGVLQMAFVAANVPHTIVAAPVWKRMAGIPAGAGKEASRRRCLQLYPELAEHLKLIKHHNRADAVLLAHAGPTLRGRKDLNEAAE
jgi:crossover junction endodeoxyribonuclease RuvC